MIRVRTTDTSPKLDKISKTTHTHRNVLIYDGIFMNQTRSAYWRVAGRHGIGTSVTLLQTNLLFMDGHAATFRREEIPMTEGFFNTGEQRWRADQP